MICLLFEEKILPATVIKQELNLKVKELENQRGRKLGQREKLNLKDEIIHTLLPRAFSKLSRVYGYIDIKNNWLVINTTNPARIEKFIELFKRSVGINAESITAKLSPTLTRWLIHSNYPRTLAVEKACVLVDPKNQKRIIRCQQQDLTANCIQLIIKDGCEVEQLAISWNEMIQFNLVKDFSLQSIKFQDRLIAQANEMEPETKRQQFNADFLIMTETLSKLVAELIATCIKKEPDVTGVSSHQAVSV
jgi:recombination associated protein RdgC